MNERLAVFREVGSAGLDAAAKERVHARLFAAPARSRITLRRAGIACGVVLAGAAIAAPWAIERASRDVETGGSSLELGAGGALRGVAKAPVREAPVREAPVREAPVREAQARETEVPARGPRRAIRAERTARGERKRDVEAASLPAIPIPEETTAPALSEASMLRAALQHLRGSQANDALSALDAYDRAYPLGTLEPEAAIARVRALRMLGRDDAALLLLSAKPLDRGPRAAELRLLRAELFVAAGRCDEARADFSAVLEHDARPEWRERATHNRCAIDAEPTR